jgi:hypothetical protein
VWHVAIFGDDFEALDGFGVAYYIVEEDWAVFLYPGGTLDGMLHCGGRYGPWELIIFSAGCVGIRPYAIARYCF